MGVAERRLQERQERRLQILQAALRVFARAGIRDATIDDIAAEAQLGKGTIYYYFPSKEAILSAAVEATVDAHFDGILTQLTRFERPYDIASAILQGAADNYRKLPKTFKVFYMVLATPSDSDRLTGALETFLRRHSRWLADLEGVVRPVLEEHGLDAEAFIGFVGTHVHGMMLLATMGRDTERLLADSLEALRQLLP